jgi:hypothetical protein
MRPTDLMRTAVIDAKEQAHKGAPSTAAAVGPPSAAAHWRNRRPTADTVWLAVAVICASALRMINLGGVGLNSDEAVYASQSASLAGNPHFTGLFPVVRAHPLLLQILMSPLYRSGVPDVAGRYVTALFGVATVALVYVAGTVLFDRRLGALAALILAVMPYHVMVSRQILLDGPMTFFTTAALTCLAVAGRTSHRRWLVAGGACLGLAALSKETAVIMVGSAFVYLALVSRLWRPVRFVWLGTLAALGIAWSYPVLTALAGGSRGGQSYLLWQLTRRPNHSFAFYFTKVGAAMGIALLVLAAVAVGWQWFSERSFSWREILLMSWIVVPLLFFEVWPVKGFSYLLPLAPVAALLGARTLIRIAEVAGRRLWLMPVVAAACIATLAVPSISGVLSPTTSGLAGAGGLPGGRETGRWVGSHVPEGAQFMTIGPSMANLIQYYSGRRCDGLSVSPNPLHRNPTYHPIANADSDLRSGRYQYIVWDAYSAQRSPQFAARALALARKFDGARVHVERGRLHGRAGEVLVAVYKVTP